jgi:hypothetical protein
MATTTAITGWPLRPDVTMAGLGVVSGIASAFLGFSEGSPVMAFLEPIATVFGLYGVYLTMGLYFGMVIAFGVWNWTGRLVAVPVLLVTTMYAWSAAIQVGIRLQTNSGDDPHLIAASLASGAVGAGLTHAGCALFIRELRRPQRIAVTCLVGAVAGMMLYITQSKYVDMAWLFIVWQPAVAYAIGAGLMARNQDA